MNKFYSCATGTTDTHVAKGPTNSSLATGGNQRTKKHLLYLSQPLLLFPQLLRRDYVFYHTPLLPQLITCASTPLKKCEHFRSSCRSTGKRQKKRRERGKINTTVGSA